MIWATSVQSNDMGFTVYPPLKSSPSMNDFYKGERSVPPCFDGLGLKTQAQFNSDLLRKHEK